MLPFRIGMAALGLALAVSPVAQAASFADVLDTPAQASPLAAKGLLQAVTRAGERVVAVGQRGHVVVIGRRRHDVEAVAGSGELGPDIGVFHRREPGLGHRTRRRHPAHVLTAASHGRCSSTVARSTTFSLPRWSARSRPSPPPTRPRSCSPKRNATRTRAPTSRSSTSGSPTRSSGYAVGAYNLIFRTDDGGATWLPWFDRTDNPKFFNLYAIRPVAGDLYIAGEGGLVLKLDANGAPLQGTRRSLQRQLLRRGRRRAPRCSPSACAATCSAAPTPARRGKKSTRACPRPWSPPRERRMARRCSPTPAAASCEAPTAAARSAPLAVTPPLPVAGIADVGEGKLALAGPRGVAVAATRAR